MHIAIIAFSLFALVGVCYAANWQTVTTITGSADQTTDYFNIPRNEWRLTWSYTPDPSYPQYAAFGFFVYPKGENAIYVDSVSANGNSQTSGASYVHEGSKDYYIKILAGNIPNYTIKIEYDTTAIPEYSTIAVIIALALVSVSVIAVRKKLKNLKSA